MHIAGVIARSSSKGGHTGHPSLNSCVHWAESCFGRTEGQQCLPHGICLFASDEAEEEGNFRWMVRSLPGNAWQTDLAVPGQGCVVGRALAVLGAHCEGCGQQGWGLVPPALLGRELPF